MKESIDLTLQESGELVQAIRFWYYQLKKIKDGSADKQINSLKELFNKLERTWHNGVNYAMKNEEYNALLNFKPNSQLNIGIDG